MALISQYFFERVVPSINAQWKIPFRESTEMTEYFKGIFFTYFVHISCLVLFLLTGFQLSFIYHVITCHNITTVASAMQLLPIHLQSFYMLMLSTSSLLLTGFTAHYIIAAVYNAQVDLPYIRKIVTEKLLDKVS